MLILVCLVDKLNNHLLHIIEGIALYYKPLQPQSQQSLHFSIFSLLFCLFEHPRRWLIEPHLQIPVFGNLTINEYEVIYVVRSRKTGLLLVVVPLQLS